MYKRNKSSFDLLNRFISIEFFRGSWIICSHVDIGKQGGFHLEIPPVRIIPLSNIKVLSYTLEEVLNEDSPVISEEEFNNCDIFPTAKAKAFGFKSDRAFHKDGRGFMLVSTNHKLILSEEKKAKGGGYSGSIWSQVFDPCDFFAVASFLVERIRTDRESD